MITPAIPERDRATVDALVADRYLDALLGIADPWPGLDRGRSATGAGSEADLEPAVRDAARVLQRALIRVHPSFRFEERLAARLAAAARGADSRGRGLLIRLPASNVSRDAVVSGGIDPPDPWLGAARRPLLVGGAITSAALSLAGVAWVAWRVARPSPLTELEGRV